MNIMMRRILNKSTVILLILIMSLLIVSCNIGGFNNSHKNINNTISLDTPWYEGEIVNVDLGIDNQRTIARLAPMLAGADDNNIVIFSDGSYKVTDWSQITANSDYAIKRITVIDRTTKHITKDVDLYNIIDHSDWPKAVKYLDGYILVKCESMDRLTNRIINRDYFINLETEVITDTRDYDLNRDVQYLESYIVGEYRIETMFYFGGEKNYCPLKVYLPDGSIKEVNIKDPDNDLFEAPTIIALDDTTVLIPIASNRDYKFYKMDLNNFNVFEVNSKEYDWLDIDKLLHSYNGSDSNVFYTTQQGVSMIDMKNKTVEQVLDYSCCGVNRQYLKNLEIADCTEDDFLLCGQYSSSNMFTSVFVNNYAIVELKKVNKNPHAGKKIIELYTPDEEIDPMISDAIIKFNNTNDKYFIKLSDRYNRLDYLELSDVKSVDDYDSAQLSANSKLSNDLSMALMNGEGPDILLNTSNLGQLNNDNYLVDLSPYITELDSDKYYTNIIEGAKLDGKLYQLPISFTIEGIQTDPEYAGNSGIGFTTDEYKYFLYETLNGKDIIEYGQSSYFVKLFNGMSNRFIANGKVDLSGSDFADIAGYVRDNVQRDSLSWDTISGDNIQMDDFTTKGNITAYYCNCPGISGYLVKRAQIKNGTAILGIPSADGRGPMFGTDISVAISAHAVNIDACVEFAKILLSDDVQNELVMSDKLVLNRDAFKKGCNAAIEYFNTEEGSQNMFDYAAGTYVTSHMKFTSEDIDNLEKNILSCSKMNSSDAAINEILIEEMPAYFLGQKDLDSVVVIIQDRAQKVLDERG